MAVRYSRQTGYTVSSRKNYAQPKRTVQKRIKFGPTTGKMLGLIAITILAIVMISQSSGRATNVYEQNSLRKDKSIVEQDIERLKIEAQRAQSLQAVQNTAVKDGMQPMGDVEYVEKGTVAGASTEQP